MKWSGNRRQRFPPPPPPSPLTIDHYCPERQCGNNVRWIQWSVVITASKALVFALVYVCLFNDHWFPAYWLLSAFFLSEFIQQAAGTWVSLHEMIAKPPAACQGKKLFVFSCCGFCRIFGLTTTTTIVFKSKKSLLSVLVVRADTSSNVSLAKWAIIFRFFSFLLFPKPFCSKFKSNFYSNEDSSSPVSPSLAG